MCVCVRMCVCYVREGRGKAVVHAPGNNSNNCLKIQVLFTLFLTSVVIRVPTPKGFDPNLSDGGAIT